MTFSMLAAASAAVHIAGEYRAAATPRDQSLTRRWPIYCAKPLTMLCIILLAVLATPWSLQYQQLIVAALVFSLVGDIALMLPRGQDVAGHWKVGYLPVGLAGFMLAHWLYVVAFWSGSWLWNSTVVLVLLLLLAAAAVLLKLLWRGFGVLRWAAALYMLSIILMALFALQRQQQGLAGGDWALLGAALFCLSDGALSINRFRRPFAHAQTLILATYYLAQWAIAMSVMIAMTG